MNLIGARYATFHAGDWLVKCEDFSVRERLPVRCYREYLAVRLGSRLGLSIPATELVVDPRYGRVAVQRWLHGASAPSPGALDAARFTPLGIRILLLDLLVANTDRQLRNLLVLDGELVPIDFNVAFAFAGGRPCEQPQQTIMRWFGTHGVMELPHEGLTTLDVEIMRFEQLVSERYVRFVVGQLPDNFLRDRERDSLERGLLARRAAIGTWIRDWWHTAVAPIHELTKANHE